MSQEVDRDGNAIICCVNHACASNGGTNFDYLIERSRSEAVVPYDKKNGIVGNPECSWKARALYAEENLLRERNAIGAVYLNWENDMNILRRRLFDAELKNVR